MSEVISQREQTLRELFGRAGQGIYVEPPLLVDYGCNISVGDGFYANFQYIHLFTQTCMQNIQLILIV